MGIDGLHLQRQVGSFLDQTSGVVLLTRMIISSLSPGKAVFCALEDDNPKFDTITECEPQWRSLGTDSKTMPAADKQL
jgi:hypothetical protein